MSSGAQDYWASSSNKMSAMLDSILAGLLEGSALLNAFGEMDMPAVVAALETGGDLMTRLEAFSTTDIITALSTGSHLINTLDAIDDTMDGKLTLTELNSAQCEMLAKLTGIDTGQIDPATLLAKFDMLDGTMDGKLDLAKLKEAITGEAGESVFGQLKASVTQLTASLTKLDTQIDRLIDIKDNTSPLITHLTDWVTVLGKTNDCSRKMLVGAYSTRINCRLKASNENTVTVNIGYADYVCISGQYQSSLAPGETKNYTTKTAIWAMHFSTSNQLIHYDDCG